MHRATLLHVAAGLAFATGVLHLIGTWMPIPAEQTEVIHAVEVMKATMVPMPVGAAKSYLQILDGNNLATALLLLMCAAQLFLAARSPSGGPSSRVVTVVGIGLAAFAVISVTHFFPVPAVLTGLASALCVVSRASGPSM